MPGQKGRNPAQPEFHGSRRSWSGSWFLTVVMPISEFVGKPTCTSFFLATKVSWNYTDLGPHCTSLPLEDLASPRRTCSWFPGPLTLLVHTLSAKFRCDLAIFNIAEYLQTNISSRSSSINNFFSGQLLSPL